MQNRVISVNATVVGGTYFTLSSNYFPNLMKHIPAVFKDQLHFQVFSRP